MKLINKAIKLAKSKAIEKNFNDVELICDQILKIDNKNIKALYLSAVAKQKLSKNDESKNYFEKILEVSPNNFDALTNLAMSNLYGGNLDEAIDLFKKALELKPKNPIAWSNLGCQFRSKKQIRFAIFYLEKAAKLCKNKDDKILINLAGAYAENLQINKSIKCLKKALKINPKSSSAHFDLSYAYGLKLDLKKCWKHYGYRFKNFDYLKSIINNFSKDKKWKGKNIEDNKTILFFSEQGIGDAINFVRFVNNFKEKFPKVNIKILCADSLYDLFSENFENCTNSIQDHDLWCPLMDLPYRLDLSKKDIKDSFVPYISSKIKCDYSKFKNYFKIGICWAGNPKHPRDPDRSLYLSYFKEIYKIPDVKLFSLQKDLRSRMWPYYKDPVDLAYSDDMKLVDMSPFMENWTNTASIVSGLDLVLSVDTSILHLSGSMGKKTFGLIPYFPDWRWGLESQTTFWYPNLKIFRQKDPHGWYSIFNDIKNDIILEKNLFFQKQN